MAGLFNIEILKKEVMIYMDENKVLGIDTDIEIPISDILNQRVPFDEADENLQALKENYKNSLTVEDYFSLVSKLADEEDFNKTSIDASGVNIVNKDGEQLSSLGDILHEIEDNK